VLRGLAPGILSGLLLVSGCAPPDSPFVRELKARSDVTAVRTDRDGTIHLRRTDGREMWFGPGDSDARRFRYRENGKVIVGVMKGGDVSSELPAGVDALMVVDGGLNYLPSWIAPTPSSGPVPEFAEIQRDRIRGSWRFETGYDPETVEQQFAAQFLAAQLISRPGVALAPDRSLPTVIDAGERGGDRFVQVRMGPRPGGSARSTGGTTGTRGEVFYEYRR
jgi:hypothetical protein